MKLIETDPKENVKLYAGVLLLVALSFFAFSLRPANARMVVARTQYQALRQEIVTGRVKAKELLGYAKRVTGLTGEVKLLEQKLRTENQLLLFLKDAEQAAGHARVQLNTIEPGQVTTVEAEAPTATAANSAKPKVAAAPARGAEPKTAGGAAQAPAKTQPAKGGEETAAADTTTVNRLPISVSVTGGLDGILRFVRYLEQVPYPVRVVKLTVGLAPDGQAAKDGGVAAPAPGSLQAVVGLEMYSLTNEPAGKAGDAQ